MDNYLVDRETLAQFVDGLIKLKPSPANSADELNTIRERAIKDLDDHIGMAVFGSLSSEKLDEINQLLDNEEENPEVFQNFFSSAGIDLRQTIDSAMTTFGKQFLGGENA